MKALIFDSTSSVLCVALVSDGVGDFKLSEGDKRSHNSKILAFADELLERNNLSVSDIEYVCAVTGPGSFTGIRIGVATANALSYGVGAKLVEATAFEPMAHDKGDVVCLIDALHGNYYAAVYKKGNVCESGYFTKEQADGTGLEKVYQHVDGDYAKNLIEVVKAKIQRGEFKNKLLPLYMRKSQAEREAEEHDNL